MKIPFPTAKALVSVERQGVLDSWIIPLNDRQTVIEVPIKAKYAPNAWVSVTAMSAQSTVPHRYFAGDENDQNFPLVTMRRRLITVVDTTHRLEVDIRTDHDVYMPGDTVKVQLFSSPSGDNQLPVPVEVAVAVVDESVLDLLTDGTQDFDPHKGLFGFVQHRIGDFVLFTEAKSIESMGVSGSSIPRGSFGNARIRNDTQVLSYWNPSLRTDESGNASFEFEIGDRLTGMEDLGYRSNARRQIWSGDTLNKD